MTTPRPPFDVDHIEEMLRQTPAVHEQLRMFADTQIDNVKDLIALNQRYASLVGENGAGESPVTDDPPTGGTTVPTENTGE